MYTRLPFHVRVAFFYYFLFKYFFHLHSVLSKCSCDEEVMYQVLTNKSHECLFSFSLSLILKMCFFFIDDSIYIVLDIIYSSYGSFCTPFKFVYCVFSQPLLKTSTPAFKLFSLFSPINLSRFWLWTSHWFFWFHRTLKEWLLWSPCSFVFKVLISPRTFYSYLLKWLNFFIILSFMVLHGARELIHFVF